MQKIILTSTHEVHLVDDVIAEELVRRGAAARVDSPADMAPQPPTLRQLAEAHQAAIAMPLSEREFVIFTSPGQGIFRGQMPGKIVATSPDVAEMLVALRMARRLLQPARPAWPVRKDAPARSA